MHRHFLTKLEKQLDDCRSRNIILVTHVLPIVDFTVQPPDDMWQYLNAFLGSVKYGELALKYSVKYAISGHVHYRKQIRYENTTFICNCLNYASQWIDNNEPVLEVARHLKPSRSLDKGRMMNDEFRNRFARLFYIKFEEFRK